MKILVDEILKDLLGVPVKEYNEEYPVQVSLVVGDEHTPERLLVIATNEGGYNSVKIDFISLFRAMYLWLESRRTCEGTSYFDFRQCPAGDIVEEILARGAAPNYLGLAR